MKPTSRDLMVARVVRDVQFTRAYRLDDQDITEIIESLPEPAELVKYGCHCDIENTVSGEPDECVFDNGDIEDCVYATQLQREDKGKLQCKYWKPVSRPEPAEHEHTPSSEAPHHPACTQSFDARDWARDFNATAKSLGYCDMDEGWLIGWFANAIMRGFDESERRRDAEHEQAAQDAPRYTLREADQIAKDARAEGARAERERCFKIATDLVASWPGKAHVVSRQAGMMIAHAIRAAQDEHGGNGE